MAYFNFGGELAALWENNTPTLQARNLLGQALLHVAIIRSNKWVIHHLLTNGADIDMTYKGSNLLKSAMVDCNKQMVKMLLSLGADYTGQGGLHGTVLGAAALAGDINIVDAVLASSPDIEITDTIMVNAVRNRKYSMPILEILAAVDTSIECTSPVIEAAMEDPDPEDLLLQLLRRAWDNVNEGIMLAAAKTGFHTSLLLNLLISKGGAHHVTEAVMIAVGENTHSPTDDLAVLLSAGATIEVNDAFLAATLRNRWTPVRKIKSLLAEYPEIPITEEVLVAAASNSIEPGQIIKWLLSGDSNLTVTDAVIITAARNPRVTQAVLSWLRGLIPAIENPERLLIAAAESCDQEHFWSLWHSNSDILISPAVLNAILRYSYRYHSDLESLLDQNPHLRSNDLAMVAAAQNKNHSLRVFQDVFKGVTSYKIPEAVMIAAAEHGNRTSTVELLLRKDPEMELTEGIMSAAAGNEDGGLST